MTLMIDKKMFYYSLEFPLPDIPMGVSCGLRPTLLYFSTQQKLEKWQKQNTELAKDCKWEMHEISVKCAKELVKLSKQRIRHRCEECGK